MRPQPSARFERGKDDEISFSVKFIGLSVVGGLDFCFRGQNGSPLIHQCVIPGSNGGEIILKNSPPLFAAFSRIEW